MKTDELFLLGKIVRNTGARGEVVFQFVTGSSARYKNVESVFIKINENLVPFFIDHFKIKSQHQAVVKLFDLDDVEDAKILTGCELYTLSGELPKVKGNKFSYDQVLGFAVIDSSYGSIGKIAAIMDLPHQAIYKIDFEGKEILIPVVPEIIKKVDHKKNTVFIDAPEGLIGIYL